MFDACPAVVTTRFARGIFPASNRWPRERLIERTDQPAWARLFPPGSPPRPSSARVRAPRASPVDRCGFFRFTAADNAAKPFVSVSAREDAMRFHPAQYRRAAIARTGIEQHQGAQWKRHVERQRHVAAERQSGDHRGLRVRSHPATRPSSVVSASSTRPDWWTIAVTVLAHVPDDQFVRGAERSGCNIHIADAAL